MTDVHNLWEVKPCCALDPEALDTVHGEEGNKCHFFFSKEHVTNAKLGCNFS